MHGQSATPSPYPLCRGTKMQSCGTVFAPCIYNSTFNKSDLCGFCPRTALAKYLWLFSHVHFLWLKHHVANFLFTCTVWFKRYVTTVSYNIVEEPTTIWTCELFPWTWKFYGSWELQSLQLLCNFGQQQNVRMIKNVFNKFCIQFDTLHVHSYPHKLIKYAYHNKLENRQTDFLSSTKLISDIFSG